MSNFSTIAAGTKSRIEDIDIVRGAAIMGILLVNGPTLNGPPIKDAVDFAFQLNALDAWYTKLMFMLAVGKFYPIFACLFGISSAIFLLDKTSASRLWFRRLTCLLGFGVLHAIFVWWGDILMVYSLLGMMLAPIMMGGEERLRKAFIVLASVGGFLTLMLLLTTNSKDLIVNPEVYSLYGHGSFLDISKQRAFDVIGVFIPGVFYRLNFHLFLASLLYFLQLSLLFILGCYFYRSGLLMGLLMSKERTKKAVWLMLALSFLLFALSQSFTSIQEIFLSWLGLVQGLLYAVCLIFLCQQEQVRRFLIPLGKVGRMSLTNYIFHNVTLSFLFYGYGLGLFGRIGPFTQAPILIALMIASLLLSSLWLRFFNFGPLEWFWRAATYAKFFPLRRVDRKTNMVTTVRL
jgi:uncharacterized protein